MDKNAVKVVNLSVIEDITPYNFGEYYNSGYKWVNFGKDNDYPIFLRKLYLNSPTHQAIVDGVINMSTGEGVEVIDPARNPKSNKFINTFFTIDVIKNMISDLKLYGYFVLQVYGDCEYIKYSPSIKYRLDKKDKYGNINYLWYSNDWDEYTQAGNRPVKIPIWRNDKTEDISVVICQMDKKGFDYYSPVDYNGSINYINLETEISLYHLSNIKNGLFPSFTITFIGSEYSDEQMAQIERDVNKKFGGSSNTGRAIIAYTDNKDNAPVISTIEQPNIDQTYTFLSEECSKKIMIGHGVTSPIIFGLRDSGGGLGNNAQELETAFYLFFESKLKYYQDYVIQTIQKLMKSQLLYADIQFKNYNPFSNLGKQTLSSVKRGVSEIDIDNLIKEVDENKIKSDDILVNSSIFNGEIKENKLYKFVKLSNNSNLLIEKLELLTEEGFYFKNNPNVIKNTEDYYFEELDFIKKSNK